MLTGRSFRVNVEALFEELEARRAWFLNDQPGVILVPQHLPIGEAIDELVLIWGASDAEEWQNRILRIPLR